METQYSQSDMLKQEHDYYSTYIMALHLYFLIKTVTLMLIIMLC